MNATFEPIEGLKKVIDEWNKSYSSVLRQALLDQENQKFLKELFTSEEEGNLLDMLLNLPAQNTSQKIPFNITETRQQFSTYFQGNFRFFTFYFIHEI